MVKRVKATGEVVRGESWDGRVRHRVFRKWKQGLASREIADTMNVGYTQVRAVCQKFERQRVELIAEMVEQGREIPADLRIGGGRQSQAARRRARTVAIYVKEAQTTPMRGKKRPLTGKQVNAKLVSRHREHAGTSVRTTLRDLMQKRRRVVRAAVVSTRRGAALSQEPAEVDGAAARLAGAAARRGKAANVSF